MTLVRADAVSIPLADESVDLIVTSPPYFALRSYTDGGEHYDGQIGSEATPAAFLEALWAVTRECRRVLKPSGSMWVNLGDKYSGGQPHSDHGTGASSLNGHGGAGTAKDNAGKFQRDPVSFGSTRPKSLMGLPWRYAIGCIDDLDLILRAEVVWCLSGGARVYAEIGGKPRPIMLRDLVRAYHPENVRLWNGEKWTQVLGWNLSANTDGALELELRSGERIGCTPGHQWPTGRGLLRADEIEVGDVLDTCPLPDRDDHSAIGRDLGWFVGLYIAEGSMSGRTIQIAGHADEAERRLAWLERLAKLYDGTCNVYIDGNNANITLTGAVLRGVLERYVSPGTAKTKRLTMHAWGRGNDFLLGIIEGYLSGDGHYDEVNHRWRLGFTENDEWAADLRTLAARLGASLTLKRATVTGFGREWPAWRGEWRSAYRSAGLARNRSEVVAIRRSRARQFFDVGVADEPHLFALASGVLTHNSKPNGLPESVTDRVRRSHEQWFHFTKEPRYFAAVDEVREPHLHGGEGLTWDERRAAGQAVRHGNTGGGASSGAPGPKAGNPLGKLPGSVWTIPSEPLKVPDWLGVDHFAAFPQEWPRRLILGWSPSGICLECGEGRRPVVAKEAHGAPRGQSASDKYQRARSAQSGGPPSATDVTATITGYACACPTPTAPTRPAVVLDPFGGTGTVAMVARALGRYPVHIDMSRDYLRLAKWRIYESGHASKSRERTNRDAQGTLL